MSNRGYSVAKGLGRVHYQQDLGILYESFPHIAREEMDMLFWTEMERMLSNVVDSRLTPETIESGAPVLVRRRVERQLETLETVTRT